MIKKLNKNKLFQKRIPASTGIIPGGLSRQIITPFSKGECGGIRYCPVNPVNPFRKGAFYFCVSHPLMGCENVVTVKAGFESGYNYVHQLSQLYQLYQLRQFRQFRQLPQ